jgi:REP element-mobilizing transposase RayT
LVFVTKYRHPVVTAAHLDRVEEVMGAVCRDFGCELAEFNGETEHVHLLVRFPRPSRCPGSSTASRASPPGGCGRSSPN